MFNNGIPNMQQGFGYGQQPAMPYLPDFRTVQSPQQPTANISWIYVNGWGGARGQIVQPGQTAWMMDNNDPVIYVKAVDAMGTASLKGFRLNEISPQSAPAEAREDLSAYAKRSELDGVIGRLSAIEELIGGLNS